MSDQAATLDAVVAMALRLSRAERARLIERVAATLAEEAKGAADQSGRRSVRGVLAEFGPAPSAEDIDEARREMWGNFPKDDIA